MCVPLCILLHGYSTLGGAVAFLWVVLQLLSQRAFSYLWPIDGSLLSFAEEKQT